MRQLGTYSDAEAARALEDTLFVEGIETTVNELRDGAYAVWVHDEDALERAREIDAEFEANPTAPRFVEAQKEARKRRQVKASARQGAQRRDHDVKRAVAREQTGTPTTTIGLALACVVVFVLMNSRGGPGLERLLSIQSFGSTVVLGRWGSSGLFVDVLAGQVWRLLTPIFMHFGLLHLVFNLSWLWVFGMTLERARGALRFALMVVVLGVCSNVVQYVGTASPSFGGMSGVIYGLFGYLWIRGRFDPRVNFDLPGSTVMILLGWYVVCFTGLVGPVANGAHTGGLFAGALWGYLASGHLGRRLSG